MGIDSRWERREASRELLLRGMMKDGEEKEIRSTGSGLVDVRQRTRSRVKELGASRDAEPGAESRNFHIFFERAESNEPVFVNCLMHRWLDGNGHTRKGLL